MQALPWMEGGEIHMDDLEELHNYVLAFGGELPKDATPPGLVLPTGTTVATRLLRVERTRDHLDKIIMYIPTTQQ